jgi:hypothetical protein
MGWLNLQNPLPGNVNKEFCRHWWEAYTFPSHASFSITSILYLRCGGFITSSKKLVTGARGEGATETGIVRLLCLCCRHPPPRLQYFVSAHPRPVAPWLSESQSNTHALSARVAHALCTREIWSTADDYHTIRMSILNPLHKNSHTVVSLVGIWNEILPKLF